MRRWAGGLLAAAATAAALGAGAQGFDHYVLALSWNPSWCEAEGEARDAPTCGAARDLGFIVHGLWPQRGEDWPEWCEGRARGPSQAVLEQAAEAMGSTGLAAYQWRKHGTCSGLDAEDYFALLREASARVTRPPELARLDADLRIDPEVVEAALLAANPDLRDAGVRTVCGDGRFVELRVCLTRELAPRDCVGRAARDCREALVTLPAPP